MLGLGQGVWRGKGRKERAGGGRAGTDKLGGVGEFSKAPRHLEVKASILTVCGRECWSPLSALAG